MLLKENQVCSFHSMDETESQRIADCLSTIYCKAHSLSAFVISQVTIQMEVSFWTLSSSILLFVHLWASTTISPVHQRKLLRKLTSISLEVFLVYKSNCVWGLKTQKPTGGKKQETESGSSQGQDNSGNCNAQRALALS